MLGKQIQLSRLCIRTFLFSVATALTTASISAAIAAEPSRNVILVNGAWADGSSWSKVIPSPDAKRLNVIAVQLPRTSLADGAATVERAIALESGPVVLVGYSYGAAVITVADNAPKVSALLYVAAFAPKTGQSAGSLAATAPPPPMATEARPDSKGFLKLTKTGVFGDFAQDVAPAEKLVLYAAQAPTNVKALGGTIQTPASRSKPSWYVVSANDRAIQPSPERSIASALRPQLR